MTELSDLADRIAKAKHNVQWLLNNPSGLVDMHGLAYWAGVLERLREELKEKA